jgi:hypothetical protein
MPWYGRVKHTELAYRKKHFIAQDLTGKHCAVPTVSYGTYKYRMKAHAFYYYWIVPLRDAVKASPRFPLPYPPDSTGAPPIKSWQDSVVSRCG